MELDTLATPSKDPDTNEDIQKILTLREHVNKLSEQIGHDVPKVDLLEYEDAFELIIDLPGVSQKNLEIAVQGKNVTIAGIRESFEPKDKNIKMLKQERNTGLVQRTITLPREAKRENATAHLREGLLVLYMPKAK